MRLWFEGRQPDVFSIPRNLQNLLNRALFVISFFSTGLFYAGPDGKGEAGECASVGAAPRPPEPFFKTLLA